MKIQEILQPGIEPAEVKKLRLKMGLTQTQMGELAGITLKGWQRKETPKEASSHAGTNILESNLLLLLADEHPTHRIAKRRAKRM